MDNIAQQFTNYLLEAVREGEDFGETSWTVLKMPRNTEYHQQKALAERIVQLVRKQGFHCELCTGPLHARYETRQEYVYDINLDQYSNEFKEVRLIDPDLERYGLRIWREKTPSFPSDALEQRVDKVVKELGLKLTTNSNDFEIDYAFKRRDALLQTSLLWRLYQSEPELYYKQHGEAHWICSPELEQVFTNAIDKRLAQIYGENEQVCWRNLPGSRLQVRCYTEGLNSCERERLKKCGWRNTDAIAKAKFWSSCW